MDSRKKSRATGAPVRRSRRRGTQEAADTLEEPRKAEPEEAAELVDKADRAEETEMMVETQAEESQDKEGLGAPVQAESQDKGELGDPVQAESQRLQEQRKGGQGMEPSSMKRKREAPAQAHKLIPQGKPKSGRVWKENKKRFSNMVMDRPLRSSWEVKMKQRQEKKLLKGLAQQIKDEKQREKEEKKRRREENLKRRLENERRAEVVQVIRNPAKLKRARKKQLRSIEKRDTLMMSQAGKKLSQKNSARSRRTEEKEAISR